MRGILVLEVRLVSLNGGWCRRDRAVFPVGLCEFVSELFKRVL
jgi:hypothetical protein